MTAVRPEIAARPLRGSFGRAIERSSNSSSGLGDLDDAEVVRLFSEHGALLFRGFGAAREEFVALTERCSRDFSTYQGGFFRDRQPVGGPGAPEAPGTLLTVTGSQEGFAIPLHGEMHYAGSRPSVLWFYCERPAEAGGETTLADGEEVCRMLTPEIRELFLSRRVRYRRELPDGAWQAAFQTDDLAEVERHCEENDTRLTVDPATRAIATDYLAWAIVPGRSGRRDTFINNVVGLYMGELSLKRGTAAETIRRLSGARFPITVRMEDGAPVPGAAIKELMALNQRLAVPVAWSAGDVLMIDNTRVLHGRAAFRGPRDVYVRMAASLI